jgi:hypothetical protein
MTRTQLRRLEERVERLTPPQRHRWIIERRIVEPGKLHEPGELCDRKEVWLPFKPTTPSEPSYRHWRRHIA